MYQDHTALEAAGQLLIAFAFLASGIRNLFWKFGQHADRMAALGVSWAKTTLVLGFVLNFLGGFSLAFDYQRGWGAALLLAFTILASAIFHRWWLVPDPLLRHLHIGNLLVNCAVVGALLLVIAI